MPSKWMPWDFVKSNSTILNSRSKGPISLSFEDPLISKLIVDKIFSGFDQEVRRVFPEEIGTQWIEQNLQSLDLFAANEFFVFHLFDKVETAKRTLILEACQAGAKECLFIFHSQDKKFSQKVEKLGGQSAHVGMPPFWDNDKLLNFIAQCLDLSLNFEVQNFLLEVVENNPMDFYTVLGQLKINCDSRDLNINNVKSLLQESRLDQFQMAEFLGNKKFHLFYQNCLKFSLDFELLENLFRFLEGHLLKLYDPTYMEKKPRPSKYDKQILTHSKLWDKDELVSFMNKLGNYLLLAKKKDHHLGVLLRKELA